MSTVGRKAAKKKQPLGAETDKFLTFRREES